MADSSSAIENYQQSFKFIIVGESGVGKTCLMRQFNESKFDTDHEITIGVGCQHRIWQDSEMLSK